jgi:PTH1 family peptidyl-tRNA hydrolase
MIHTVIGLGNPGKEYENTRHNLGFRVVDELAQRLQTAIRMPGRYCLYGRATLERWSILLVKPTTYMNRSGLAWQELAERFNTTVEQAVVVCDDLNLSLGQLRIRTKGSDGGHNGLASILEVAGTECVARLRLGIGEPIGDWVDFVLSPFEEHERPVAERIVSVAADAVEIAITQGIAHAMDQFNNLHVTLE